MSSLKNGVLPCPFGECGGVCEGVVAEDEDGEDGGEDGGEENGDVKGGLSPFPFGGLSSSPPFPPEEPSPFGGLELSPCDLGFLSS